MNDLVPWLQDAVAAAFVVLGLVTAISWLRSRDRSMGFLALAIILLSAVSGLGPLQAHLPFTIPLLVARNLPAVQAWRLRSLSIGFGGLVGILLFAISIGFLVREPIIQVIFELAALAIVPLLYASFAPPTWLRRQWRAPEEEGLRAFMEDLLVNEDRDALAKRALEWATRLVGGAAAVQFDAAGKATASRGVDSAQVVELGRMLPRLHRGVSRISRSDVDSSVIVLPVAGLSGSGTLVVLAGPFTPGFGGDEMNRTQQLMSAFVTALDRRHLIVELEQRNLALQEANRHKSVFLAN